MNIDKLKDIGERVIVIVFAVLLSNEIQKQIDKRKAAM